MSLCCVSTLTLPFNTDEGVRKEEKGGQQGRIEEEGLRRSEKGGERKKECNEKGNDRGRNGRLENPPYPCFLQSYSISLSPPLCFACYSYTYTQNDVAPEAQLPPVLRVDSVPASPASAATTATTATLSLASPPRTSLPPSTLFAHVGIPEEVEVDDDLAVCLANTLTLSPAEARQQAIDANPAEHRLAVRVSLRVSQTGAVWQEGRAKGECVSGESQG